MPVLQFGRAIVGKGEAMSVIMTLLVNGDAKALERFTSENKEKTRAILEQAKGHGLIAHRFYGADDGGGMMVVDEWPDKQSFEEFFREQESVIMPMMAAAHVTGRPEPTFWEELATGDAVGWGA